MEELRRRAAALVVFLEVWVSLVIALKLKLHKLGSELL
jgi:hypothetical protein